MINPNATNVLDSLSRDMIEREGIRSTLRHKFEEDKKNLPAMQKYFSYSYSDFLEELLISVLHKPENKNE